MRRAQKGAADFILVRMFKDTLETMVSNRGYIILPGLFDILFFLFYGFITFPIWQKILEHVQAIAYVAQAQHSQISELIPSQGIVGAFAGDATGFYLRNFLILVIILALVTYFLYCFFQAIAWYFAHRQVHKGVAFHTFLWQFFRTNILWYMLFLVYYGINVVYGYVAQRAVRLNAPNNVFSVSLILLVFLGIIAYFAVISYGLVGRYKDRMMYKKTFWLGISKILYLLPLFLILIGIFIIINYLLTYSGLVHQWLAIALGFILVIPALAFARLYVIKVVGALDR